MLPALMGFISPGAMPYHRLNFELEMLTMEHNQLMSDLQKLPMEISDALDKCKRLMEETESLRRVPDYMGRDCFYPSLSLTQSEVSGSSLSTSEQASCLVPLDSVC